ncbi:unnamed protein product [Mycoplasma amphoriforme A39]|uniref:Uncharacterized protein n=1 Tax=Mycoplasma amphoriforme A39 TaxID=572419 RepID=A0A292IJ90_9MOLU|nr:unnamed protein product [Mycoplasma amphoriforme A39]
MWLWSCLWLWSWSWSSWVAVTGGFVVVGFSLWSWWSWSWWSWSWSSWVAVTVGFVVVGFLLWSWWSWSWLWSCSWSWSWSSCGAAGNVFSISDLFLVPEVSPDGVVLLRLLVVVLHAELTPATNGIAKASPVNKIFFFSFNFVINVIS